MRVDTSLSSAASASLIRFQQESITFRQEMVWQEIWSSLVSLLRVYSNAASLNLPSLGKREYKVTETATDAVLLQCREVQLTICFDTATGRGSWHLMKLSQCQLQGSRLQGEFRISEDSTILFDSPIQRELELDEAAIEWVEQLTQFAARHRDSLEQDACQVMDFKARGNE